MCINCDCGVKVRGRGRWYVHSITLDWRVALTPLEGAPSSFNIFFRSLFMRVLLRAMRDGDICWRLEEAMSATVGQHNGGRSRERLVLAKAGGGRRRATNYLGLQAYGAFPRFEVKRGTRSGSGCQLGCWCGGGSGSGSGGGEGDFHDWAGGIYGSRAGGGQHRDGDEATRAEVKGRSGEY